jgi:hypothetical protein
MLNSIRPSTPIVRHNFKSIDELISRKHGEFCQSIQLNHCLSLSLDDTGYNSQLSISFQSQENDDNIENIKPTKSSTPMRKKTKKARTAFTDDQKQYLDHFYSTNRYPDSTQMEALSSLLSLEEKVIRVWFQNKRSREKLHCSNL